jgi:hypothetical protein
MTVNTKHITLAVVLAIISFGTFGIALEQISSNGIGLEGEPAILFVGIISLFSGLVFLYLAKWMYDTEETKQNLK